MENKFRKRDFVKLMNSVTISFGAGVVTSAVLEMVLPEGLGKATRLAAKWSATAIASSLGMKAANELNEDIEVFAEAISKAFADSQELEEDTGE